MRGQIAATCSMAITASISEPSCPQSRSGSVMPISPCLASTWQYVAGLAVDAANGGANADLSIAAHGRKMKSVAF